MQRIISGKHIIALLIVAAIITASDAYIEGSAEPQHPGEIAALEPGSTVLKGQDVIDESRVRSVPLILHPDYILDEFNYMDPGNLLQALLTGAVHVPISRMTSGIDPSGRSTVDGPGVLRISGDKLVVQEPPVFLWAYKTPYTYGVKREKGIDIIENGRKVRFVPADSISNSTVPHRYKSVNRIKRWFRRADDGDEIVLDYQLSNFSDGRLPVPPGRIEELFGGEVIEYMENYPSGAPVMVYTGGYRRVLVSTAVSYLGSYPQYDDNKRAFNARAFAAAWNGTVIPPGSEGSGKETVRFTASRDPEAPGGYASHGSCPPARALRAVVTDAGMPLPRGMTWEFRAVLFGFNPATGIKVRNTGRYRYSLRCGRQGQVRVQQYTPGSTGLNRHRVVELISAVITAAGRGSRMCRDMLKLGLEPVHKLLLPLNSVTVIEKTVDSVLRAGVDECIVVTGHHAGEVEEAISGLDVEIVRNDPPDVPLSASLLNGVLSASGEVILCVAGDQPAVSPETMGRITEQADPETVSVLARGRSGWLESAEGLGMPLAASSDLLKRYLPRGDGNINPLLHLMVDDGIRLYGVEASDPIELVNVNHYSDYIRIREFFGRY